MNDKSASCLDETINEVNQHNGFCMTHLLWDPMVKKQGGGYFCKAL